MSLADYNRKRKFDQTPEPKGIPKKGEGPLRFVVQMHAASRMHFDFRLEADEVLKSWAIPKGPSMNAQDQRLAVQVEDHPLNYGSFEGIIPKGNYGAGTVLIWDEGTYVERNSTTRAESEKAILKGIEKGHITFILEGKKLRGEFALIHLKKGQGSSKHSHDAHKNNENAWLLIKKRDEFSSYKILKNNDQSVKSGRTLAQIASEATARGEIWLPARTQSVLSNSPQSELDENRAVPPPKGKTEKHLPLPPPGKRPPPTQTKNEAMPRRTKPMLPIVRATPFDQSGWIFEGEQGGFRALAEIENGTVHLYSKQLLSFNLKFPQIVDALRKIKLTALVDGEIVQNDDESWVYWIRDLLHLNGLALHSLPLLDRKKALKELKIFSSTLRYSPHKSKNGMKVFEEAQKQGLPAILARDAFEPYHSGTNKGLIRIPVQTSSQKESAPRLTHLNKLYWTEENITKGDLINYYRKVAPYLLSHLEDRPQSMHRFPDGIEHPGFFHKDLVGHHPRWVKTTRIQSHSAGKSINYLLCQNESTLLYMINLGCIELNPWLSRVGQLDRPDFIVIDLDPDDNPFSEVVEIALAVHKILDQIDAFHLCKTSGGTGLHIYIPIGASYSYEEARGFALEVCAVIHNQFPKITSLERSPAKRKHKIYLDCFQNAQGQTVASVYCARPQKGAPVSTPLQWAELTPKLTPLKFTVHTVPERLASVGDLWAPLLKQSVNLERCLLSLRKKYPIGK
jgi:bifunctional non-homologous end joining protein LigD